MESASEIADSFVIEMMQSQWRAYNQASSGTPVSKVLKHLLLDAEELVPDEMYASFMSYDHERERLVYLSAPHLPLEFMKASNDIGLEGAMGSCAAAFLSQTSVYSPYIPHDPCWAGLRKQAVRNNILACWSTPVFGSDRGIIGVYSNYFPHQRAPDAKEKKMLLFYAQTIALVLRQGQIRIEKQQALTGQIAC